MNAELFLPWPVKALSPNGRFHWARVAKAKKSAKREAGWIVASAKIGKITADAVNMKMAFYPPDERVRDVDNIIASLKAAQDGIAEAIGVDDSRFKVTYPTEFSPPVRPNGMVKVELSW